VLKRTYENQACSIAGALELVGERWSLLVLRDIFIGIHRFDELQGGLGIARNVLRDRLNLLVDEGVLEKRRYQERPERFEYHLTEKGRDLWPIIHALMSWGDKHSPPPGGPATVLVHRDCGGAVQADRTCAACGEVLTLDEVKATLGPGATPTHPLHRIAARA
jgi:DNA-binding HxlR family transcriptional regulator